jgi:hypothetical protein
MLKRANLMCANISSRNCPKQTASLRLCQFLDLHQQGWLKDRTSFQQVCKLAMQNPRFGLATLLGGFKSKIRKSNQYNQQIRF